MRVLLVHPNSPQNLGPEDKSLQLAGKKAYTPPLGLLTVAALLPEEWSLKLVDMTFQEIKTRDWNDCDLVLVSTTSAQMSATAELIEQSKRLGKIVAVGGPGVFHFDEEVLRYGADYVVKGEGEVTVPSLLERLDRGEYGAVMESPGLADMTQSPVPRYDLLDMDGYSEMSMQFTRGCPFACEFCQVTPMLGRSPRSKRAAQLIDELQTLYDLGWRRQIFVVDDNFVGNQSAARKVLRDMIGWTEDHRRPMEFFTHASVNLARSPDLMEMMLRAGFVRVLVGIETTDIDNLKAVGKIQNVGVDLDEACRTINRAGLQVVALMMMGFDDEKLGQDLRIIDFAGRNQINEVSVAVLQALPGTALWNRLESEGRLIPVDPEKIGDIFNLSMNFKPSRPMQEIYQEFVNVYAELYQPAAYYKRTVQHFLNMKPFSFRLPPRFPSLYELGVLLRIVLQAGIFGSARREFLKSVWRALRKFPQQRFPLFMRSCIMLEHFSDLGRQIADQLRRRV